MKFVANFIQRFKRFVSGFVRRIFNSVPRLCKWLAFLVFSVGIIIAVFAWTLDTLRPIGTLAVYGYATEEVEYDTVDLTITIRRESDTYFNAQQQVQEVSQKVLRLLRRNGVTNVHTQWANTYRDPGSPPWLEEESTERKVATITLKAKEVKQDTVKRLVPKLAALEVEYNVNTLAPQELVRKAREKAYTKALKDARQKAREYSKELGVFVAGVESVELIDDNYVRPLAVRAAAMEAKEDLQPLPLDTQTVEVKVLVVFRIR